MKKNYHSIKSVTFILFAIILIFTSCNSKKLTSDYPSIYSDHHEKPGFRSDNRLKTGHTKIAFKDLTMSDVSSIFNSESITLSDEKAATKSKNINAKSDMQPITRRYVLPISDYDQGTLTASLSDKPFSPVHRFRPDTAIKTTSAAIDTSSNKVTQTLPPDVKKNGNGKVTAQTNREIFAIISPIAALLAIGTLFLALPGAFIVLASAAVVFGALGLKSSRKKLARLGLTIGIMEVLFIIGLVLYVSMVGFSGGL